MSAVGCSGFVHTVVEGLFICLGLYHTHDCSLGFSVVYMQRKDCTLTTLQDLLIFKQVSVSCYSGYGVQIHDKFTAGGLDSC